MRLLLCVLAILSPLLHTEARKLHFLQALWRHGDRSAIHIIPTDVNNTAGTWPQGLGQLSTYGMSQQLALGSLLRQNYGNGLFSGNYSEEQVYVRSTDWNRTLMSAYSNMAGLYPGTPGLNSPSLSGWPTHWVPVPVHTVYKYRDNLLWTDVPCPAYDEYVDRVIKKQKNYTDYQNNNQGFFTWLSSKTGLRVDFGKSIRSVADTLYCERAHNSTHAWPNYINESVYQRIYNLSVASHRFQFHNPYLARLRGGNLLGQMTNHMFAKINCLSNSGGSCTFMHNLKYYAYSAHDTTVMALMSTLGAEAYMKDGKPGYAGCVLLELWEEDSGQFTVQALYKDSYAVPAFSPIHVSGCPDGTGPCPLGTFNARSSPFVPLDWHLECASSAHSRHKRHVGTEQDVVSKNNSEVLLVTLCVLCGVLFASVIILSILLYKKLN